MLVVEYSKIRYFFLLGADSSMFTDYSDTSKSKIPQNVIDWSKLPKYDNFNME